MNRVLINTGWRFFKNCNSIEEMDAIESIKVNLPHTWNNLDGQDGGNDYFRGKCFYRKKIALTKKENKVYYLEFRGVNAMSEVFVNGVSVAYHEGGFSTFRANITDQLVDGENTIIVSADNSSNDRVYPQMADFTFFGGIYRNVYIIEAPAVRFDLDYLGGEGVKVTPIVNEDGSATVTVDSYITGATDGGTVKCDILFDGEVVATAEASATAKTTLTYTLENPTLWDGVENPALYTAKVTLTTDNDSDERVVRFGVRTMKADKDGFWLNGRKYPLHGVSRHQDRQDMGWAITEKEHKEDIDLIKELGANIIRLAHYQHDQYFYDLCDEYGMVVWAEIPYISSHLANGDENAVSQMKELITQNYNHASIFCWGLSNEITITGESEEMMALHHRLNDLCHDMDKTRPTTMANVTMLDINSPIIDLPDIMSYNHYFGWYMGDVNGNAEWLDDFRAARPDRTIGISEYGCEAILTWHNSDPKQGDYSEEYQAYYHESLLRIFAERPYIWATHVWNMFDFGVDGRNEGGVAGRNNKGLVTYDRKIKKDSFYIYKAYWTTDPFVHITSKRYYYRAEKTTTVKVYSNCDKVTLYVNGKEFATQEGKYIFTFEVPLKTLGATKIKAVSGDVSDEASIKYVRKPYQGYILKSEATVDNWFDKNNEFDFKFPEGYFSIKDKLGHIMATEEGEALINSLMDRVVKMMMSGPDSQSKGEVKISKSMMKLASSMTIERIAGLAGDKVTADMLFEVNEMLNKIKKPQK
ncbi:MAG: glycoside hydrolase family 2 TIM barrel-domain containing protein [Eubacteriales bacterium]|nr:glycoside hydrolase family 2 TIM barrel-domain containing protein [Eubacteriales bacterium]